MKQSIENASLFLENLVIKGIQSYEFYGVENRTDIIEQLAIIEPDMAIKAAIQSTNDTYDIEGLGTFKPQKIYNPEYASRLIKTMLNIGIAPEVAAKAQFSKYFPTTVHWIDEPAGYIDKTLEKIDGIKPEFVMQLRHACYDLVIDSLVKTVDNTLVDVENYVNKEISSIYYELGKSVESSQSYVMINIERALGNDGYFVKALERGLDYIMSIKNDLKDDNNAYQSQMMKLVYFLNKVKIKHDIALNNVEKKYVHAKNCEKNAFKNM
ncbi:MAG: hypothetical protein ACP5NV_01315 [Candidatus Woesearchaeota archaeon]